MFVCVTHDNFLELIIYCVSKWKEWRKQPIKRSQRRRSNQVRGEGVERASEQEEKESVERATKHEGLDRRMVVEKCCVTHTIYLL